MAFSLPSIQMGVPIVDPNTGGLTSYFSSWLTQVLNQVTAQINSQSATIAALQSTQAQLQAAILAIQAIQAGGTTPGTSGFATQTMNVGLGWSSGPGLTLTGVAAGHLMISGSGPTRGSTTYMDDSPPSVIGNWRIQEIIGITETTVFTGTFTAESTFVDPESGTLYFVYSNTDTTAVSIPRATTGTVGYRMDLEFTTGFSAFNVVANLYVNRVP